MTFSPSIIGIIIYAVIIGAAFAGWGARQCLPAHHLKDETKNLVSVSMGVVGTISALVLGLLISNANTSFIARTTEVTTLSADILRLDQMLHLYGPEASPARGKLLQFAERKTNDLFPKNLQDVRVNNESTYEVLQQVEFLILELDPADARRRWFLQQALLHAAKIGNTHWLLGQEDGQGTPKMFVAVLVFWLSLLFASFGLFAPRNLLSGLTLVLCAIAVSGGVEMILELERPFSGALHISPLPMHRTVDRMKGSNSSI